MKQVYNELFSKDFGLYWQETGTNKRLNVYTRLASLAEGIKVLLKILICILITNFLLDFVIRIVDGSSALYLLHTKSEIIKILKHDLIPLTFTVCICLWTIWCFLYCVKTLFEVGFIAISSSFDYAKRKMMLFVSQFPILIIVLLATLNLMYEDYEGLIEFLFDILALEVVAHILNLFVVRVNGIEAFAKGKEDLIHQTLSETQNKVCVIVPDEEYAGKYERYAQYDNFHIYYLSDITITQVIQELCEQADTDKSVSVTDIYLIDPFKWNLTKEEEITLEEFRKRARKYNFSVTSIND